MAVIRRVNPLACASSSRRLEPKPGAEAANIPAAPQFPGILRRLLHAVGIFSCEKEQSAAGAGPSESSVRIGSSGLVRGT